jgi:hypothetical protein
MLLHHLLSALLLAVVVGVGIRVHVCIAVLTVNKVQANYMFCLTVRIHLNSTSV